MLKATEAFRNKVLDNPSFLEWKYVVKNGGREYDGEIIKNLTISGQLQNQFTIGSSLSKSLELELLVSEETVVDPIIMVEASVVIGTEQIVSGDTIIEMPKYSEPVIVGYFHVTEVDRGTYGKLKIYAIDMMGHPDYLSNSVVDFSIFNDIETDVEIIVGKIAEVCGLSTNIADEYKKIRISNFFTALTALTYKQTIEDTETDRPSITHRQLLEYVAGFCGCNVRINSYKDEDGNIVNEIELFKFTHAKKDLGEGILEDIVLFADNYYSMTKGIHEFKPAGIVCTGLNDKSILVGGTGKDSETIKMTNPFIDTKDLLLPISRDYCEDGSDNRVSYYPITAELVGTCLFEPGDIVTIEEVFSRDIQTGKPIRSELRKVYIQDYKLTFNNGVKETIQSFFDYNKGSIANSISGKISQLNTDLENTKTYISENYVSTKDFKITVEDISTNVQYANDGLNKWIVEYYELTSPIEGEVYDMDSVMGLEYRRRELIEDDERLVAKNIYEGITVCRFKTGIYVVPEGGALFKDVDVVTTVGAYVYINGGGPGAEIRTNEEIAEFGKAYGDLSESYPIRLRSGWNIVEIYVGYDRDKEAGTNDTAIDTLFWLYYPLDGVIFPYYNISATYTQAEKDEEDNKKSIIINYRDHTNTILKRAYQGRHEIDSEYDVTSYINEKYINIDGNRYYFLETKGETTGTVKDTIIIDVIYLSEDYFRRTIEYRDSENLELLETPKVEYIRKNSVEDIYGNYKPDIGRTFEGFINRKTVITQFRYSSETDTVDESVNEFLPDTSIVFIPVNTLVSIVECVHFEPEPEKVNVTLQYINYATKTTIETKTMQLEYSESSFTISNIDSYAIIGSDDGYNTSIQLYDTRKYDIYKRIPNKAQRYKIYLIEKEKIMIYFEVQGVVTGKEIYIYDKGVHEFSFSNTDIFRYYPDPDGTNITYAETVVNYDEFFEALNTDSSVDVYQTLFTGGNLVDHVIPKGHQIPRDNLSYDVKVIVETEFGSSSYNLAPSLEEDTSGTIEDTNSEEKPNKTYKRFPYITLINPYVIDINYKYVKEVERLTTADSIIDRITEKKYMDDDGNEYNGADYLYKQSSVVQTIDNIEQRIEVEEKTSEEMKEQMSSVNHTVDGFKLTFETALYGNYLSNSAFSTDDPLTGFNYTVPKGIYRSIWYDVFTYRLDNPTTVDDENGDYHKFYSYNGDFFDFRYEGKCNINDNSKVVDKEDIENYAYLNSFYKGTEDNTIYPFKGVEPNDSENSYSSSNRTLSMGNTFKLSQTFNKDDENFPFFKDTDTGEYYQLYVAIKAKRTENCIRELDKNYYPDDTEVLDKTTHVFPKMKLSVTFNYDYEEIIDDIPYVNTTNLTINNIDGQPSTDEGKLAYGKEVDLDNLKRLESYEIDTEWKLIEYFVNLPEEIFDNMLSLNTVTVNYEIEYGFSISKSYIHKSNFYTEYHDFSVNDGIVLRDEDIVVRTGDYTRIYDAEPIDGEMTEEDSIFICEPMFGITKNYSRLPFTTKKAELITGVTNITQDGIQISRSDSLLTTEIKNNGMSILYDSDPVAIFQEKTIIPELEVTKKLTAPNIFINDYERALEYTVTKEEYEDEDGNIIEDIYHDDVVFGTEIPTEIIVDFNYTGDDLGYWGGNFGVTKIAKYFNYFNEVWFALRHYGVVQLDKLTIRVKKDPFGVYPFGLGGGGGEAFHLENLRCGIIDIVLEEDVVLACPIVLKNIEGTVRIRGPKDEHEIVLDDAYINGVDGVGRAPIVPGIIAHNVRWVEIFGINFDGGNEWPDYNETFGSDSECAYDAEKGGWVNEEIHPDQVFQTYGEYITDNFNDTAFPFCNMYNGGSFKDLNKELHKIRSRVAIFIGYCTLVDISYCNFPSVIKETASFSGTAMYDIGVLGDHCDCYLSHNKGTFRETYYKNRDKCWFRIPPEGDGLEDSIPSVQPEFPEGSVTTTTDLTDKIFPGGMIAKNKTTGTALGNCFIGKSRDLAFLGSFQHNGGSDISWIIPYVEGSNPYGYSRVKKDIKLKPLDTLYNSTDGYFFGAGSSLPSINHSPNKTNLNSVSYTGNSDLKYTSLYNGLGVSIELPDLSNTLINRELRGARLELEFETKYSKAWDDQTLVEYGSTTAFGIYQPEYNMDPPEGISLYGGEVQDPIHNAGVSFGVRFVYDKDAHYDGSNLRMGYYNMGKCTRAHEILDPGDPADVTRPNSKAINTWAIDEEGNSIHNIKNFSHGQGARPYYVGTPLTQSYYVYPQYNISIDLGVVTEDWFDDDFMSQYKENYANTSSGNVSPESFFNTLTGIATGAIKYIDIVPVGVKSNTSVDANGNPAFPTIKNYSDFNYDITGEEDSTIALATSCFKIKRARLALDTYSDKVAPKSYTLTIKYVDTNGNTIRSSQFITKPAGTTINIEEYKYDTITNNGNQYAYNSGGESSSIYLDSDKEVTFIYTTDYTVTVKYLDTNGSSIKSNYVITVESGKSYDVSAQTNVTISGYNYSGIEGDPVSSSSINGNKTIIVRYAKIVYYTVTVKYLDTSGSSIRSNYVITVESGKPYDVSAQTNVTISGYIKSSVSGGSTSSSSISGNVTITVTYRLEPIEVGIEPSTFNMLGSKYGSDEDEAPISSDLYLGELWDESPNNSGANDLYARVRWNGGSSSPLYLGAGSRQNYISCNDFYTWGTLFSGIQLNFDWDTIANRSNTASSIKLKLTFDSRQFGIEGAVADKYNAFINDNIHFNVRLLLGSLKANERLGVQKTLDYSDYSVEIGNIGGIPKEVYTHYGYVTGYWRRPGDVLDPNNEVYGNTFVLTQSQTTFELDLLGIKIAEDISFRNQVMGANYPEMPAAIFTDIRKLFNGKYVKAIQIIPVTDVPTDDPILTIHSVGCRKLIDSKLIIE